MKTVKHHFFTSVNDIITQTTDSNVTETVLDNGSISADLVTDSDTNTTKVFSENNEVYCDNGTFTYNEIAVNGDIITATNGEVYNNYQFDAYGKKISQTANDRDLQTVTATATTNPIGYRNYYYDDEIEMYYLQSRYYDQNIGRFINSDDSEMLKFLSKDSAFGCNVYLYCYNNSINNSDNNGCISLRNFANIVLKILSFVFCYVDKTSLVIGFLALFTSFFGKLRLVYKILAITYFLYLLYNDFRSMMNKSLHFYFRALACFDFIIDLLHLISVWIKIKIDKLTNNKKTLLITAKKIDRVLGTAFYSSRALVRHVTKLSFF